MIDPKDLKIEYFEAQPTGGELKEHKHAVRITHLPTGFVASSNTEGSKDRNREHALYTIKGKLVESTSISLSASNRTSGAGILAKLDKIIELLEKIHMEI